MNTSKRTLVIRSIGLLFFIFILVFGYNRFRRYIRGPEIIDISINDYEETNEFSLPVLGRLYNVETITISGRNITFNDDNTFEEIIILSPGENTIVIQLIDPFGKEKKYTYTIYSTQKNPDYSHNHSDAQEHSENTESILINLNE